MAIKAIINNTEKEIEQIKNSDEQDVDYVYSRIGDTEVEGESPISIKSIGGELANYRIYGNTVGGESVGDRTANLFDMKKFAETASQSYATINYSENSLIFIAIRIDAYVNEVYSNTSQTIPSVLRPACINVQPRTTYTITMNSPYKCFISWLDDSFTPVRGYGTIPNNQSSFTFTTPENCTKLLFRLGKQVENTGDTFVISNIMLNEGSTALPYEPYGYKMPVTVEGKNILPMSTTPISTDVDDFHCEYDGTGTITLTTDKDNAVLNSFSIPLSEDFIIPVSIGQGGDGCAQFNNSISASLNSNTNHIWVNFYYNSTFIDSWGLTTINRRNSTYSSMGGKTMNRVIIEIKGAGFSTNRKIVIRPAFVLNTTEQVPFEPYHAPVTTPIYLPEQIKKVGDVAEYIDYGEQKLHRVRKNLLQNQAVDREIEGVTFTVNSDGSITCNGTASDNTNSGSISSSSLPAGSYYLNGTPSGGSLSTYYMFVACYTESEIILYNDVGDGVSFTIDNSCNINVRIAIKSGCTCNNLTFYPMIRKADITDDTYEPYIVNTEVNTNLPALSTIKGINILSVNTSIQPSNIYIKDSFDYKKVFTATRAIEDELPLNYKNIEDNDSTLKNYRIYGQTSRNLFNGFSIHGKVPSVSNGELVNSSSAGATTDLITIDTGDITLSKDVAAASNMYIFLYSQDKTYIGYTQTSSASTLTLKGSNINGYQNAKYARIRVDAETAYSQANIMLNTGSTPLPYEPYGESVGDLETTGEHAGEYKVPVTVTNGTDTETTNIYLPEQIKMVGDEAEYIDYAEQKQYIETTDGQEKYVVGLNVDFENKTFKRLADAVGLSKGADFDNFSAFGGRRRCNVADNGTITAYYGDANYTEDGSNGQVMVYQPAFYYKVEPLKIEAQENGVGYHLRNVNYYISNYQGEGYKLHPAFYNEAGDRVDYILVGAYEGCIYDTSANTYVTDDSQVLNTAEDKFSSIANVKPASGRKQSLTRSHLETICKNRGDGWHSLNVRIASMEQLLMIIEFGTMNTQTGAGSNGIVSITDNSAYNCSSITGSTADLGNASGQASGTYSDINGIRTLETANGKTAYSFRGDENPWGNIWKAVYGVNIWGDGTMNGGAPYICKDYNFAESKRTDNYESAGFTLANANGYINAMGWGGEENSDFDWLLIPSETGGNSSLPVGDYSPITANLNGYKIARLGGYWADSVLAGDFHWYLNNSAEFHSRDLGGRLVYMPQIEKQHIYTTDLDVTLPALPTLSGTNTLTVGTEVQPSSVEIKGHIK